MRPASSGGLAHGCANSAPCGVPPPPPGDRRTLRRRKAVTPKRKAAQPQPATIPRAVSKRLSPRRNKPVSGPQPTAVQGNAKTVSDRSRSDVETAKRLSRFSQFLKSIGIDRGKLPPLTNGELRQIAGVDLVQWHGWQHLGRALPLSQPNLSLAELPNDLLRRELLPSWHLVPSLGLHHQRFSL